MAIDAEKMAIASETPASSVLPSQGDIEKTTEGEQITSGKTDTSLLKTTKDGVILVPQPSDDPADPLNWSFAKKHAALVILAFFSFFLKFTATLIAPGALTLAAQFHTSSSKATYIGSAPSVMASVAPFFWIPLSHRIGRRPVLLLGNVMAICFAVAVGRSESYAQALVCRFFMGFGAAVGVCIGPAAISDMFFLHEKGTRLGINTLLLICAPYAGGIAGGSVQYNPALGWRWSMYVAAILYGTLLIAQIFLVPETLYDRETAVPEVPGQPRPLYRKFGFRAPPALGKETWLQTYSKPFVMFAYPVVVLPSFWFSVAGMMEVATTAGFPLNFGAESRWKFNTQQIGFCSFSGLIGAVVGEFCAGPICDFVVKRNLRQGKEWKPEKLFVALWSGVVAITAGLLLYGLELSYPTSWAAALTGVGIFTFGQEVLMTVLLTYMCDVYPHRASECAVVFQFFLNLMAFHPPFYTPQWMAKDGAKVAYSVFAVLPLVVMPFTIGLVMWRGPRIRAKGPLLAKWAQQLFRKN